MRVGFFLFVKMCGDQVGGLVRDVCVATAAGQPVDFGVAAKPRELALGVVAMALLGLSDGLIAGEVVAQDGGCFSIAE